MKFKPVCRSCKKPFLIGDHGLCRRCLDPDAPRTPLRCQCGQLARQVILATVLNPAGVPRTVQLALCPGCLELERQMEAQDRLPPPSARPNPIKILVVHQLPPTDNPPKGRRIA